MARAVEANVQYMTNDFVLVKRNPTSQELLSHLIEIAPSFSSHWGSKDNDFIEENGSFTVHGVFAKFGRFLRDSFADFSEQKRKEIFDFVEWCLETDLHSNSGVGNAACTCFLENLAGEAEISEAIEQYLGSKSKEYFDNWN